MSNFRKLKVFTGNGHPGLVSEIAEYLGVDVSAASVKTFSDGEINVFIEESVRGVDVFVIQPTCTPINDNLMELLILIDALRRASARRITAVLPYYGYARQDRKAKARDPITAKLVANLITAAGARRVLAVDLHAGQIQGFFDIPVDHLQAVPIIAEYFLNKHMENALVVSPDLGGVTRARALSERLNVPLAIIDKRRPQPNQAEIMNIIGEVKGKRVIMIDDIIDTAGTITLGAQALIDQGAEEVYVCCTHPVLSGAAIERLEKSPIKEVVITNTIPLPPGKQLDKIKSLSIAPLLGEAIIRIHEDLSVSKLFD
ncbi:MAG: ribose-phosphate pyrophosphokinase [Firmicutes bacterium HGW-Firmicutes-12]|jgi:ribose-phosphate pyrophosphokinase|nr:MAG: ribose-phosphate pyrophosphokinase [Firmicutes bacterium HGW-Firmicutes-12]